MREFWVRLVSAIAVVGLIFGYNSVLDTRAKDDQIAKLNAKITDENPVIPEDPPTELIKTELIPEKQMDSEERLK